MTSSSKIIEVCEDVADADMVAQLADKLSLAQLDDAGSSEAMSTCAPARKRGSRGRKLPSVQAKELEDLRERNADLQQQNEQLQQKVQELHRKRGQDRLKRLVVLGQVAEERRKRGESSEASGDERFIVGSDTDGDEAAAGGEAYSSSESIESKYDEDSEEDLEETESVVSLNETKNSAEDLDAEMVLASELKLQVEAIRKLLQTDAFVQYADSATIQKLSSLHDRALDACGHLADASIDCQMQAMIKWITMLRRNFTAALKDAWPHLASQVMESAEVQNVTDERVDVHRYSSILWRALAFEDRYDLLGHAV